MEVFQTAAGLIKSWTDIVHTLKQVLCVKG